MTGSIVYADPVYAKICNRIVAFVNDDIITLHELRNKIKEMTGIEPESIKNREKYLQVRRYVLQTLIDEKITHAKAKELGITITDAEIDNEIERIKKDNNLTQEQLLENLKSQGISHESFRKKIRHDIEQMRLTQFEINSKIVISEEAIQKYYEEHKDEFKTGNRVHLATIILIQQDSSNRAETMSLYKTADVIMARLKNGQKFERLAAEFSEGPGADDGGDLGVFDLSSLDPVLKAVVEKMSPGEVSRPIKRSFGIQIIKLIDKQDASNNLSANIKDSIRQRLYRIEIKKRYDTWIKNLRKKAYTKIIF
jgi:peptidyl-prolyl cis-trans isomerase SurA